MKSSLNIITFILICGGVSLMSSCSKEVTTPKYELNPKTIDINGNGELESDEMGGIWLYNKGTENECILNITLNEDSTQLQITEEGGFNKFLNLYGYADMIGEEGIYSLGVMKYDTARINLNGFILDTNPYVPYHFSCELTNIQLVGDMIKFEVQGYPWSNNHTLQKLN